MIIVNDLGTLISTYEIMNEMRLLLCLLFLNYSVANSIYLVDLDRFYLYQNLTKEI